MADIYHLRAAPAVAPKLDANKILKAAKHKLQNVVVIGWTLDGSLYVASTDCDPDTLWMIEKAKQELLDE